MYARMLLIIVLLGVALSSIRPAAGQSAGDYDVYLPLVTRPSIGEPLGAVRRVNVPYINGNGDDYFPQTAIFWFGRITSSSNSADVRMMYNNTELYVYVAVYDRRVWSSSAPSAATLTDWDALALYLNLNGVQGAAPTTSSYRFTSQFSANTSPTPYRAAARGNGSAWSAASVAFTTLPGWRGMPSDNGDDRGWAMTYRIPFSSLGLSGPPTAGTRWGLAMTLHDRDSSAGPPGAVTFWPENMSTTRPDSWGILHFGAPSYQAPGASNRQTTTIRHGLNGAVVTDGSVGGHTICGSGLDFWTEWGEKNWAAEDVFNVQNQSDIADWPCFSRYYVKFPLTSIPAGKVIVSATLRLHQIGNSEPSQATPSYVQVFTVAADWQRQTLNWNNAPLALENVGGGWVNPIPAFPGWPGVQRDIDVSLAVSRAYLAGQPLRLALYSADTDYHSGKYFVGSTTGDWNAVARPTLIITYGNP